MITIKTAAITLLAATTLVGTALAPAFAQRPYNNGNGYSYGRGSDRNSDRNFDQGWNNNRNDRDDRNNHENGQVRWNGVVDDTAIITIQGRDVRTQTTAGRGVSNVSEQMDGRLPDRRVNVALRRVSGRGQVEIIEQPSRRNDFTTRVRVRDSQGGSSRYSFVLGWQR